MEQFRIRDGNLGLICMEVLAQAIEVTKFAKKNNVERSRTGPWGVHFLRKVRRQERRKYTEKGGVSGQKKAF